MNCVSTQCTVLTEWIGEKGITSNWLERGSEEYQVVTREEMITFLNLNGIDAFTLPGLKV